MNWKNRLTNYNFWVSIVSAVILILQALDIKFDFAYLNEVATAVLGLLVVIGIINDPTKSSSTSKPQEETATKTKQKLSIKNNEEKIENSKNSVENGEIFKENTQNLENSKNFSLKNNKNFKENELNLQNEENFSLKIEPEKTNKIENKQESANLPIEQTDEVVDGDIQNCLPLPALNDEILDELIDNESEEEFIVNGNEHIINESEEDQIPNVNEEEVCENEIEQDNEQISNAANKNFFNIVN